MGVRKLAVHAIMKITEEESFANLTVNEFLNRYHLKINDRRLFTKIVYGTIENLIKIDYYLSPFIKRKPQPFLKCLLYSSIYQIEFTDIPTFAIVDEAVKIAKEIDKYSASFINGVLRSYLRTKRPNISKFKENAFLSIEYSHPVWLVDFLLHYYDYEITKRILEENNSSRDLAVRINTIIATVKEVETVLKNNKIDYKKSPLTKHGIIIKGDLHKNKLLEDGFVVLQDASAQLVAEMINPKQGSRVLDLCAAPGGKTAHLAALMNNTGTIYACDIYPHKLTLMKKLFQKLNVKNVKGMIVDATKTEERLLEKGFDYVLADVPCSGLGVISHKKDLKYRIDLDKIKELIELQKNILQTSWSYVKQGGLYCYSTCTINPEENEQQIKKFLSNNSNAKVVTERMIMPYEYHTDGFYICIMKKQ